MRNSPQPSEKFRRPSKLEELAALIQDLSENCKLEHWSSFVEPIDIPGDLYPALMSGRSELIRAAQPRAMTQEEVAKLYKLIIGLMETNMALHKHAEQVAKLVDNWQNLFKSLESVANQIWHFANFRSAVADEAISEGDDA